jgi:hypothetical protein
VHDKRGSLNLAVGRHRADANFPVAPDAVELGDPGQADQDRRSNKPVSQHQDKRRPAGDDPGVLPVGPQLFHRLAERVWLQILKRGQCHATLLTKQAIAG